MNSTQYLIILITAVVCFCIYVLAEIVRLRKRGIERQAMRGWVNPYHRQTTPDEAVHMSMAERYRLTEEIRTRLEGGDSA